MTFSLRPTPAGVSATRARRLQTHLAGDDHQLDFRCALTDFEDPGPLKSFIDEGFISGIMIEAQRKGYLDQRIMARTFSYPRLGLRLPVWCRRPMLL